MTSNAQPTASRESSEFEFVSENDKENENKAKETASAEDPSIFGWVKGSGGLLSKVAEKTKSSVESVIMVLDPQMKDYIHSGGNLKVVVASDNQDKVNAIKNAFHDVFGLATVYGVKCQPKNVATQPVGFAAAKQGANERISIVRNEYPEAQESGAVLIAVENFLLEVGDEEWVDQGCLVLSDKIHDVTLYQYTQATSVPFSVIQQLQDQTDENYPLSWSGYSSTVGFLMAEKLKVAPSNWHEASCGVSRSKLLEMAAKSLAYSYKLALKAKVEEV